MPIPTLLEKAPGGRLGFRAFSEERLWFVPHVVFAILVLAAARACLPVVLARETWMLFVEDDFFYYLKIAQNLATGHGSTFNGLVPSNGYHPLWLLLLATVARFTSSGPVIAGVVASVGFLALLATYLLAAAILRRCSLPSWLASLLAAIVAAYSAPILFRGMEVTLTVPLLLAVIAWIVKRPHGDTRTSRDRWRRSFVFGLLLSLMVLSRLDSALFALLLLALPGGSAALRGDPRKSSLIGFSCGLLPVCLYILSNAVLFRTVLPISGMAKQLKHGFAISRPALESALDRPWHEKVVLLTLAVALCLLPAVWGRMEPRARAVSGGALLFPFLYILVLAVRSDWPLWPWYLYAFRPGLCVAFIVLWQSAAVRRCLRSAPAAAALALLLVVLAITMRWSDEGRRSLVEAAADIREFAKDHPGIYAMGDRSGAVGYLLPNPVVQTEGLVMDRPFLEEVRRSAPLAEVLTRYRVSYYVGSSHEPMVGCFHASEPAQAGPASPHMRGEFCGEPEASFHRGHTYTYIYRASQGR